LGGPPHVERGLADTGQAGHPLERQAGDPLGEASTRTRPETPTDRPLTRAETGGDLRPEPERVPEQGPAPSLSLRSAVHRLHAIGVTDPATVERHASAVLGREVSRDSVDRYLREARQAQASAKGPQEAGQFGFSRPNSPQE
ncbi:hypothetical protein, partial [Streptomyces longwoodensis]|uniref:hypothetical protein n=1 Tax=Streptomyces longwoodensis TaxID=68231 RepID=UPI0033EE25A8